MGIKKIEVYSQIYLYTKEYVDFFLSSQVSEPEVEAGAGAD